MRSFVGLPIPEPWIARLVRVQHRVVGGRNVLPGDFHLTLAFLGEASDAQLEEVASLLSHKALKGAEMRPHGFDALRGKKDPRAVALMLATNDELTALRDAVRSAARQAGIDLPRERFRPHVTVARFAPGRERFTTEGIHGMLTEMGHPEVQPARATALTMWSSTLTPEGPVYEPLQSWPLG